jgi:hypothetical protein
VQAWAWPGHRPWAGPGPGWARPRPIQVCIRYPPYYYLYVDTYLFLNIFSYPYMILNFVYRGFP